MTTWADDLLTAEAAIAAARAAMQADAATAAARLTDVQREADGWRTRASAAEARVAELEAEVARLRWPRVPGVLTAGIAGTAQTAAWAQMRDARPDVSPIRASRLPFLSPDYVTAVPTPVLPTTQGQAFVDDMTASYAQALEWSRTGDAAWRDRAIRTLSAWSGLQSIAPDTARNDKLWAGWGISIGARAVSLLGGHDPTVAMFVRVAGGGPSWPVIDHPQGSNWMSTHSEARLGLAVLLRDRALFDREVARFRRIAPYVVWLASDGPMTPLPGMNLTQHLWGATAPTDGEPIELRRDLGHTMMGLAALVNAAHTATLQGVDLLTEHRTRIVRGYERLAVEVRAVLDGTRALRPQDGQGWRSGWPVALSAYGSAAMPTSAHVAARTAPPARALHMAFERVTHPIT